MSLRTKLLAAVIGLNGAILLLALALMLREEQARTPPPWPAAFLDQVALGAGVSSSEPARGHVAAQERAFLLERLAAEGHLADLHVVEEGPTVVTDEGSVPHRVWAAETFLEHGADGEQVPEGPTREAIVATFQSARRNLNRWTGPDRAAVVLPPVPETRRDPSAPARLVRRGLVATYAPTADGRGAVRGVYLVMVAGVIVLTGVSSWLVSRWVVQPLRRLSDAADHIASGDNRIRIHGRPTGDELDRTFAAFNRMAGEIAEYQGHLEDRVLAAVERQRRAEQHLAIAQRLAATGKLASGIAHEINNPLGGMKNAVRALARGDLPPAKTEEYLSLIADGLARVEETVKKVLSFTPRRLEPRATDLADVARKAIALVEHRVERRGIDLVRALPPAGEVVVYGDPHELQQVVLNLVLNAVDAIPERPAAEGPGRISVGLAVQGEDACLEVADDGVGMSPEDQSRCFDIFFTTKDVGEGTGLGLAVVHNVVTNHGGRIEVESAPGQGTRFRVVLPREDVRAPADDLERREATRAPPEPAASAAGPDAAPPAPGFPPAGPLARPLATPPPLRPPPEPTPAP